MTENQIQELVRQMTLEEKAALCSGADFWHTSAVERLDIPALTLSDGPSGLRKQDGSGKMGLHESSQSVSFPSGSLVAASFDRELLKTLGETLGAEARAEGIDVLLGPSMNLKRSPLCGRNFEYYSEDPYLSTQLAGAYVDGVQSKGVGSCPKHFYANNMEERRMSASSELDERTARELYLASFEMMVREHKPHSIMCAYNKINGTYAAESKDALTDILRKEWGFDGMVVSDWGAVNDRVADLEAGLDLEMPSSHGAGAKALVEAVQSRKLDPFVLNQACSRILRTVFRCHSEQPEKSERDWEQDHQTARKIASESMVLLKNDGLLPLNEADHIAFIGKYAKDPRFQGGGSSHVHPFRVESVLDAAADLPYITFAQGFDDSTEETDNDLINEAIQIARIAEVAVLFVGLPDSYESEGIDREHLRLPPNQNRLIEAVCSVQPHVVVVLHNGAPVEMPWLERVQAVLESYLGGEAVGAAQIDLLFGRCDPCGRLAETFPIRLEDNPSYLNFHIEQGKVRYREGVFMGYRYYTSARQPAMFPFGHGLSYTTFAYSNLQMDSTELQDNEKLKVSVDIRNTGNRIGKEVVQLYVAPAASEVHRPTRELKGFEKISLVPGERKTVTFTLDKRSFAFWDEELHDWNAASGYYVIEIGRSSVNIQLSETVLLHSTTEKRMHITRDTAIGDLTPEQIELVMAPFSKRAGEKHGDTTVSDRASKALQVNMPLRSLVAFGAMDQDGLEQMISQLNG